MSISSLVLELWQFTFIRNWPEIQKSEIPPSDFCPISGDWGELGIPNLAWISLIKFYLMLQNARVTAFTVSELLRENQQGGLKLPPTRLGLRKYLKTGRTWLCQAIGKLFFRTLRRGMKVKNCFQNTFTSRNGRMMTVITNHTSACLFSCKFVAYFLNTFSKELFWTAASGHLNSF